MGGIGIVVEDDIRCLNTVLGIGDIFLQRVGGSVQFNGNGDLIRSIVIGVAGSALVVLRHRELVGAHLAEADLVEGEATVSGDVLVASDKAGIAGSVIGGILSDFHGEVTVAKGLVPIHGLQGHGTGNGILDGIGIGIGVEEHDLREHSTISGDIQLAILLFHLYIEGPGRITTHGIACGRRLFNDGEGISTHLGKGPGADLDVHSRAVGNARLRSDQTRRHAADSSGISAGLSHLEPELPRFNVRAGLSAAGQRQSDKGY